MNSILKDNSTACKGFGCPPQGHREDLEASEVSAAARVQDGPPGESEIPLPHPQHGCSHMSQVISTGEEKPAEFLNNQRASCAGPFMHRLWESSYLVFFLKFVLFFF